MTVDDLITLYLEHGKPGTPVSREDLRAAAEARGVGWVPFRDAVDLAYATGAAVPGQVLDDEGERIHVLIVDRVRDRRPNGGRYADLTTTPGFPPVDYSGRGA